MDSFIFPGSLSLFQLRALRQVVYCLDFSSASLHKQLVGLSFMSPSQDLKPFPGITLIESLVTDYYFLFTFYVFILFIKYF